MKLSFTLLISGFLLIAGCSHTAESPKLVNELTDTEWGLEEIDGRGVVDNVQSTLRFETHDRITGWGGCNRYFTGFRSTGNGIKLGPIGSTRRICPPVVMDQEDRFFQALEKARTDGKIRFIGFSSHSIPIAMKTLNTGLFQTLQFPFNFIEKDPADELFPLARKMDVGLIDMDTDKKI